MKYLVTICLLFFALQATDSLAQSETEVEGVTSAVEDYVLGFYKGDSDRIRRSVRENVTKYGFVIPRDEKTYAGSAMSFEQMIAYCDRVKERERFTPDSAVREIEVLDMLDQTAVVKLTAVWGVDYLQLAKYDGKWMIIHVLWQTHPVDS